MNDIAKIERALKDADNLIVYLDSEREPNLTDFRRIREQITEALMLLRKQPSFPKPQLLLSEAKVTLHLIDDFINKFHARADNLRQAIKINGG